MTHCEDAHVVTCDFVAVIDGATSTGTRRSWTTQQYTSGQWASTVLVQGIQRLSSSSSSSSDHRHHHEYQTAADIVDYLSECLAQAYRDEHVYDWMQRHPQERATASMALYSRRLHQIIIVGDCQAALLSDNDDGATRILQRIQPIKYNDQVMAAARAMFWQIELLRAAAADDDDDDVTTCQRQTCDLCQMIV